MTTPETIQTTWGLDLSSMVCDHCGWNYLTLDNSVRLCPHCSKGKLEPFDTDDVRMTSIAAPELILQYRVGREQMTRIVAQFTDEIPYPPHDLNASNLSERIQRVFLPMWLVDGAVQADWQAQAGYDYEVESHKSSYNNGQWRSQKVTETRVEWEERIGKLSRHYDNISAPALDEHAQLMRQLGRYDIKQAESYAKDALRTALIRLPNRSTDDAFIEAQEGFRLRAAEDVKQATESENIRNFRWQATYDDLHWTQLLLPVYMSFYQDDEGERRVVIINGYSGQSFGERRGSMRRAQRLMFMGLAFTAIVAIIAVIVVLSNPQWDDLAATAAIIAGIVGIASLIPVAQVWRFNNTQAELTN
ncbi:MAG: hypothetical protein WBC91_09405 [Phototrophicaceae bacterium]